MISDAERDYRQYRGVVAGDGNLPADFLADVVNYVDDTYAQEGLWKLSVVLSLRQVIVRLLPRLCSGFLKQFRLHVPSSLISYRLFLIIQRCRSPLLLSPRKSSSGRSNWILLPKSQPMMIFTMSLDCVSDSLLPVSVRQRSWLALWRPRVNERGLL